MTVKELYFERSSHESYFRFLGVHSPSSACRCLPHNITSSPAAAAVPDSPAAVVQISAAGRAAAESVDADHDGDTK